MSPSVYLKDYNYSQNLFTFKGEEMVWIVQNY